jgi:ribose-phosphate pyrophosphokinase
MNPFLFALPDNDVLASTLAKKLGFEKGRVVSRRFPDGETYVRFEDAVADREIILFCSLNTPDDKILPLYFLAETARDLGAKKIGLVAPYLAYMRQDIRFKEGEGVTSRYFSKFISNTFDWLVTVDPHLHRYHSLNEIYSIPNRIVHAANIIAQWIQVQIKNPLLIGPDSESEQWVSDVAKQAQAPYIILQKIRHGDNHVDVSIPAVEKWKAHTPVLIDDIISTGHTMMETIGHLKKAKMPQPVCIGVHGIFSDNAYENLRNAGAKKIVTCNTLFHSSNAIDVTDALAAVVKQLQKEEKIS